MQLLWWTDLAFRRSKLIFYSCRRWYLVRLPRKLLENKEMTRKVWEMVGDCYKMAGKQLQNCHEMVWNATKWGQNATRWTEMLQNRCEMQWNKGKTPWSRIRHWKMAGNSWKIGWKTAQEWRINLCFENFFGFYLMLGCCIFWLGKGNVYRWYNYGSSVIFECFRLYNVNVCKLLWWDTHLKCYI